MQRYKCTGLSLPAELLRRIDLDRGDIPRSRFLLRLLEKVYPTEDDKEVPVSN